MRKYENTYVSTYFSRKKDRKGSWKVMAGGWERGRKDVESDIPLSIPFCTFLTFRVNINVYVNISHYICI